MIRAEYIPPRGMGDEPPPRPRGGSAPPPRPRSKIRLGVSALPSPIAKAATAPSSRPFLIAAAVAAGLGLLAMVFGAGHRRGRRRGATLRSNPSGMGEASAFREAFTWGQSKGRRISRVNVSKTPRRLVKLGTLEQVTYSTTKKGDGFSHYVHDFESKRPTLAMDLDNRRLHVVGGGYTVTSRGIER